MLFINTKFLWLRSVRAYLDYLSKKSWPKVCQLPQNITAAVLLSRLVPTLSCVVSKSHTPFITPQLTTVTMNTKTKSYTSKSYLLTYQYLLSMYSVDFYFSNMKYKCYKFPDKHDIIVSVTLTSMRDNLHWWRVHCILHTGTHPPVH